MKCNECKRDLPNKSFKLKKGCVWCSLNNICPHCKGESKNWVRGTCPVCFLNPNYRKGEK